jgi:sugar phosphate isomerase/epimerase
MKTGYHAVYSKDYFDGIDAAKNNGFDFVQFELGVPNFFLNDLSDNELKQIRDYAKDNNIQITFHAPGDNVSLFCDYPLIRKGILDECKLILDKANILNARHLTFHAGVYSQFKKSGCKADDFYTAHYEEVLYENVKCLTDYCGNVLICIENYMFNAIIRKVTKKLINEKNPLYLTLDTAKLYSGYAEIIKEDFAFYSELKDYIREIHIHDANKEFGQHQIVGTGTVDFKFFRQFYNENVYVNFEVRPVESAKISKDNLLEIW